MDKNKTITHYAFHSVGVEGTSLAVKLTKAKAIELLETKGNVATTWVWNYTKAEWGIGENVEVVNGIYGKYLRSNPDNKLTDNLAHLIYFNWIAS